MSLGSSEPWHETLTKVLGSNSSLSGDALLDYYTPMLDWLKAKNRESKVKIGWNSSQKSMPFRKILNSLIKYFNFYLFTYFIFRNPLSWRNIRGIQYTY